MKIVLLTYEAWPTTKAAVSRKVGGLNTIIFYLSRALSEMSQVEVRIACCCSTPERRQAEKTGSNVDEVVLGVNNAGLVRYLSEANPTIVHTAGSDAGSAMAEVRQSGLDTPWVHTNYATLAVRRAVVEKIPVEAALRDAVAECERLSLISCDRVIALSEVDKLETCAVFGIGEEKVEVSHPGVDSTIFTPGPSRGCEHLAVSAGRMSGIKDYPFLLRAFRSVVSQNRELPPKLLIIGGNESERQELGIAETVKQLGLETNVQFLDGMDQAELARYFRRAKVFVGSSKHETFGLLPLEARACGTPTVVRNNSSYVLLGENGHGGYVVDNQDEKDMANKIAGVLSLKFDAWQRMSEEALESSRRYSWLAMARRCMEVYRDVEKSRCQSAGP